MCRLVIMLCTGWPFSRFMTGAVYSEILDTPPKPAQHDCETFPRQQLSNHHRQAKHFWLESHFICMLQICLAVGCANLVKPPAPAKSKGVNPFSSSWFTLAPLCKSSFTQDTWPPLTAWWRGVRPQHSGSGRSWNHKVFNIPEKIRYCLNIIPLNKQ